MVGQIPGFRSRHYRFSISRSIKFSARQTLGSSSKKFYVVLRLADGCLREHTENHDSACVAQIGRCHALGYYCRRLREPAMPVFLPRVAKNQLSDLVPSRPCTPITAMVPFIIVPLKKKGLVWQGRCFLHFPLAGVAQLVEHLICNQRVRGSNPFASSRKYFPAGGGLGSGATGFSNALHSELFRRVVIFRSVFVRDPWFPCVA